MGSPLSGCVVYSCALDQNEGFFRPSILRYFAMGSSYGSGVVFPPTRSKRSFLWMTGRYSFQMRSPFLGQILTIWSRLKELLQLGSWECFSGLSLGCLVILWSSTFSCLHFWCGLCVSLSLTTEGLGVGPSPAGPVASRPPLVSLSASAVKRCFFHQGVSVRGYSVHGGSLAPLPEVGLPGKGC